MSIIRSRRCRYRWCDDPSFAGIDPPRDSPGQAGDAVGPGAFAHDPEAEFVAVADDDGEEAGAFETEGSEGAPPLAPEGKRDPLAVGEEVLAGFG